MDTPLSRLKFEGTSDFIKWRADVPQKLRVISVNPVIHENSYTDPKTGETSVSTKYAFAVWNYTEDRAMILDASPSIAKEIHRFHTDIEYGEDITQQDIRITPTGEMLERRYSIDVLPKAQKLNIDQETAANDLDKKLDTVIKNGIRAEDYNNGDRLSTEVDGKTVKVETVSDEELASLDYPKEWDDK